MLSRLNVKNIALIDEADINFGKGLNILSGETGSGKSVILDSINFVLGSKTDKTMIRSGQAEALVRAEFFVAKNSLAAIRLRELDVDTDGEIIITRKFSLEGKSVSKINGNTVTAAMLKSVTQHLVDVHGQSEHFFLLNEENQLNVVDDLCGAEGEAIKSNLSELLAKKRDYKNKIAQLGGDAQERERKLDLLAYQINEIEKADIKEGEFNELLAKRALFQNAEKILEAMNLVQSVINDDGGCADGLSSAIRQCASISNIADEYEKLYERLENLRTEAEDIASTASDCVGDLSFDEREAEFVDDRISHLKGIMKKYGNDELAVLSYFDKISTEYNVLCEGADAIERYQAQIDALDNKIFEQCCNLTKLRKNKVVSFCKAVENELHSLNIPNAKFSVAFTEYDRHTANLNSEMGSDVISFMFSANRGEPLKPLSKIISGGEMSRFMLAVKTQLQADNKGISTFIFDEIDAGISGYTAKTVAEKFKEIAKNTQIIAVSHLPQVSAASDCQYLIYKSDTNGKTVTRVKELDADEKINEIVRLTGSVASAAAIQHAKELIAEFN